jgi:hypothetical protein
MEISILLRYLGTYGKFFENFKESRDENFLKSFN